MPKITNLSYRNFLDKGEIDTLSQEELEEALDYVDGINKKHIEEGKALLLVLYYTGCRPIEALKLQGQHVYKEGTYIKIAMQTAKRGVNRVISLPYRLKLVRQFYDYAQKNFREKLLFFNYRSKSVKRYQNNKGEIKGYENISHNLDYHIKKGFTGVRNGSLTGYFLRHNRFSSLAEAGVSPQDIQFLKGGRDYNSVNAYLHLSRKKSEELAKKIK